MIFFKPYEYLFYRLYVFHDRLFGGKHLPHDFAYMTAGVFLTLNLFTVLILIDKITAVELVRYVVGNIFYLVIILLFVIQVLSYFLFVKDGKYREIVAQFKTESDSVRKRNAFLVGGYMALTFILLFLAFYRY